MAVVPARFTTWRTYLSSVALAGLLSACGAPAPTPTPPAASSPSTSAAPTTTAPAPATSGAGSAVRLAPRDPALEAWKRAAA